MRVKRRVITHVSRELPVYLFYIINVSRGIHSLHYELLNYFFSLVENCWHVQLNSLHYLLRKWYHFSIFNCFIFNPSYQIASCLKTKMQRSQPRWQIRSYKTSRPDVYHPHSSISCNIIINIHIKCKLNFKTMSYGEIMSKYVDFG